MAKSKKTKRLKLLKELESHIYSVSAVTMAVVTALDITTRQQVRIKLANLAKSTGSGQPKSIRKRINKRIRSILRDIDQLNSLGR